MTISDHVQHSPLLSVRWQQNTFRNQDRVDGVWSCLHIIYSRLLRSVQRRGSTDRITLLDQDLEPFPVSFSAVSIAHGQSALFTESILASLAHTCDLYISIDTAKLSRGPLPLTENPSGEVFRGLQLLRPLKQSFCLTTVCPRLIRLRYPLKFLKLYSGSPLLIHSLSLTLPVGTQ